MKAWWRSKRPKVLSVPFYYLVSLLGKSLKVEADGFERYANLPEGVVFSGWHGRTIIAPTLFRGLGYYTLISLSKDGEIQNFVYQKFGFKTIRGSSNRGGARALVEIIKVLRNGAKMAFTPDGPRGPSGIVQEGILFMAQKSGALIVPVGVSAKKLWILGTWDKFMVPKPFTQSLMLFGDAITVPKESTEQEISTIRLQLEQAMHRTQAEADRRMGHV